MRAMRMTEFPVLEEIKDEYIQLRQNGNDRATAVQKLKKSFNELQEDDEDEDAQLFRIGLADAQYYRKELTVEVAQNALKALDVIAGFDWDVCPGDLNRRREHYAKAPMPERKAGKPRPKFRCQWKIGDTFAYQLTSQEAKDLGIYGKYMLLRKVSEVDNGDGSLEPIVTLSFWEKDILPVNDEDFMTVPLMKLQIGGRCLSPRDRFEYRANIHINSPKKLDMIGLIYLGNFLNVSMPKDEIVFSKPGEILILLLEMFEENLWTYWKRNKLIISN